MIQKTACILQELILLASLRGLCPKQSRKQTNKKM